MKLIIKIFFANLLFALFYIYKSFFGFENTVIMILIIIILTNADDSINELCEMFKETYKKNKGLD